nr:Crp/Fnr family transcriptional regulator [uncultured Mucilaginibacter sp.]
MDELKLFLQSLSPITEDAWADMRKLFNETTLRKGECFCVEGTVCRDFGFLRSGLVRGFYRGEQGTEYNKHFFTTGSVIGGYTSLITRNPNHIIQQALTDCEVLVANYTAFTSLYNVHPCLERIGRVFAERYFVQKEQKELEMVFYDALQRYRIFQNAFPGLEQLVPQYHIASYLGISATQLSRIRKNNYQ